jgi:predicted ferric reductase
VAIATKSPSSPERLMRRVWKAPISAAFWLWLAVSIILYAGIYAWYLFALRAQPFAGPALDPLRFFGIIAFVMVLGTAAYSLRRRFVRSLPGMARNWLWMHTWIGIASLLIAFLHENYAYILHDYCSNLSCFSQSYFGPSALFALLFLVISGIVGRILDLWQARIIARDASTNGVGIMQALEERIRELEYTVERLSAGKSEPFKQYCWQALERVDTLPTIPAGLVKQEQADFQRVQQTLVDYARLVASLQRQKRARLIFRTWRYVHITLAVIALLIITYHALLELLTSVLGVKFV